METIASGDENVMLHVLVPLMVWFFFFRAFIIIHLVSYQAGVFCGVISARGFLFVYVLGVRGLVCSQARAGVLGRPVWP